MVNDVWFQSLMVRSPAICGRRLLPFSIAHQYTLEALGNPYSHSGRGAKPEELLQAVFVCSLDVDALSRRIFYEQGSFWFMLWLYRWGRKDLTTASKSFQVYLTDYRTRAYHQPGDGRTMKAPWSFHLVRVLMSQFNMTEKEAWETPYGRAWNYYDAWSESQGDESLSDELEAQIDKLIREGTKLIKDGDTEEGNRYYATAQELANERQKKGLA